MLSSSEQTTQLLNSVKTKIGIFSESDFTQKKDNLDLSYQEITNYILQVLSFVQNTIEKQVDLPVRIELNSKLDKLDKSLKKDNPSSLITLMNQAYEIHKIIALFYYYDASRLNDEVQKAINTNAKISEILQALDVNKNEIESFCATNFSDTENSILNKIHC